MPAGAPSGRARRVAAGRENEDVGRGERSQQLAWGSGLRSHREDV